MIVLPHEAPVDELEERAEQVVGPWSAGGDRLHRVEAEVTREGSQADE